jgi:hypothetical protein
MTYQNPLVSKSGRMQVLSNTEIINHGDFPPWATNPYGQTAVAYTSSIYYKKLITVDHTKIGSTDNLRIVIPIVNDADLGAHAQLNGYDIFLVDANGNYMHHDIMSYSVVSGLANGNIATCLVSPSTSVDTTFYLCYGIAQQFSLAHPSGVWNTYRWVSHLEEAYYPYKDVAKGYNTVGGTYPTQGTGKIGNGQTFNGSSMYLDFGLLVGCAIGDYTASAWIKPAGLGAERRFMSNMGYGNYNGSFDFLLDGSNKLTILHQSGSAQSVYRSTSTSLFTNGVWAKVEVSWASPTGVPTLYVNGSPVAGALDSGVGMVTPRSIPSYDMRIGSTGGGTITTWWSGMVDEVRFADYIKPAALIATEYTFDTQTCVTVGAETSSSYLPPAYSSWPQTRQALTSRIGTNLVASQHYISSTFTNGSLTLDANKWSGGVLAPSGSIYCVPYTATTILKIDPTLDTAITFGSLAADATKWIGGVLAPNGCIYCIPYTATTILKIDPTSDTTTTFGSLVGDTKWVGGVVGMNGMIYGVPHSSTSILKIDPTTDTVTTFGAVGADTLKWQGGVLAPNGCIYCAPFNNTYALKIDPSADTYTLLFGSLSGTSKWIGAVLAPNGCIYCIPCSSTTVLKVNPFSDTFTTFGSLSGSLKWSGGVLAPDGMIYGIPQNSTTILKIDPTTDVATTFGSVGSASSSWLGGILAQSGVIYGVPQSYNYVLKIGTPAIDVTTDFPLSRHFNKF